MEDLKVYFGNDPLAVSVMAMQCEAHMLCDDDAQARYAEIYGEPWQSLSDALRAFAEESPTLVVDPVFDACEIAWFRRSPDRFHLCYASEVSR